MDDNKDLKRFENHVGNSVVYANYKIDGSTMYINYVEAPVELRGSGVAGKLMAEIMDHARTQSYKVVPICGYAAAWIKRHPEYQELVV